jgi:DNA-binding transcriptional MerR regulator
MLVSAQATSERMRIDDLAQRSGVASGTIRFYQREGLIPPPEREGRVAFYSEDHLRRLERVRALQAQGLPLSVVGDLLAREDAGEDIAGWLALDSAVFGRPDGGEPIEELTARLLEVGVPPDTIAAGAELIRVRLREVAETMSGLGWEVFAEERERLAAGEQVPEDVLARFEHLRSLAQRIVQALFRDLLDEAIRERTEPFAEEAVARRRGKRS